MSSCGEGAEWVEQLRAPRQGHCTSQSQPVKATLLRRAVTLCATVARWLRRQNRLIWYYLVHDNFFVSGLDWGTIISVYFSEELFSAIPAEKEIRVNDRGAIVNFMLGLNAYTISSGIFPKYLNGDNIIAVPLSEQETMHIGCVLNEKQELSKLGKCYLEELQKYAPRIP